MYSEKSASYFDFAIVTIYRARKPQNLRQHAETCCPRKKSRQLIRCAIYASSFNCRIVSLIYLFPISNYLTIIIEVLDFCIPLYPHLSYSTHRCDSFIERNGERDLHPRYHWEFKRQHLKRRRAAVSRPAICHAYRSIRAREDERILNSKRDYRRHEDRVRTLKHRCIIDAELSNRPQVLSIAPGPEGEYALIQHKLDHDPNDFSMSDTEGLCLNITVPASKEGTVDASSNLPVFVFVHGGGFNVGSGMYPQYNMSRFVHLSTKLDKPIIAVSLNYRLGAPGLLTSKSLREKGYKPNNTLRDQRTALLWLHHHLAGFGGDAQNITLAGESAGGISVCYHLFSEKPLFKRVISMSGTQLLMPPITPEVAEGHYERALKALNLQDGDEAVEALTQGFDGKELAQKLMGAGIPNLPVLDEDLCPSTFTFRSIETNQTPLPGRKWCAAAIIGDCQFDGSIQSLRLNHRKAGIASAFCASISSSLSPHPGLAEKIFDAYALTPETPDEEAFESVLRVANDLNFYLPTLSLAQNLSVAGCKTFMYRFNEPNPWDGQWKGQATHILDITFLLQNFNEFLGEEQRRVAEGFAKDVVGFVNGGEPWGEWGVAKVLGPGGRVEVVEDAAEEVGRRGVLLTLGREVGLDTISEAFDGFMKGAKPAHGS